MQNLPGVHCAHLIWIFAAPQVGYFSIMDVETLLREPGLIRYLLNSFIAGLWPITITLLRLLLIPLIKFRSFSGSKVYKFLSISGFRIVFTSRIILLQVWVALAALDEKI